MISRAALKGASVTHSRQICGAIDDYIEVYNPDASPSEWTKDSVHQVSLPRMIAVICATKR